MPHEMRWLVDKRVVLTTFHGNITAEELTQFVTEIKAYIADGTPLVHHISNSLDLQKVEFSLGTISSVAKAASIIGQLGWQVDVNINPINRMFANLGSQFANIRTRTFATQQEAIDFLKENDTTLAELVWKIETPEKSEMIQNTPEVTKNV